MRKAEVFFNNVYCGELRELDNCFEYEYSKDYLSMDNAKPISLTMPLSNDIYRNEILFSFFDGLIPEGYLLDLLMNKYKLKVTDRFDLLVKSGLDTIGAVTIKEKTNE